MSIVISGIDLPKDKDEYTIIRIYGNGRTWADKTLVGQAIQIPAPQERLANDIKKMTTFIEPCMIIASTYDEQIERAENVKRWLLSIL